MPLLGSLMWSSCCLVQLVMNALSLGCAGFSALDRLRPFFIAATVASLKRASHSYAQRKAWARIGVLWGASLLLACSPAILRCVNTGTLGATAKAKGGPKQHTQRESNTQEVLDVSLRVRGVKCEACANGLRSDLLAALTRSQDWIVGGAAVEFRSVEDTLVAITLQHRRETEAPRGTCDSVGVLSTASLVAGHGDGGPPPLQHREESTSSGSLDTCPGLSLVTRGVSETKTAEGRVWECVLGVIASKGYVAATNDADPLPWRER